VVFCELCGAVHHYECWYARGGCASPGCAAFKPYASDGRRDGDRPPGGVVRETATGPTLVPLSGSSFSFDFRDFKARPYSIGLFAFILICFFLPFYEIECDMSRDELFPGSGQDYSEEMGEFPYEISFSGFNLMSGTGAEYELFNRDHVEYKSPAGIVIVIFILAIAGLALGFSRGRNSRMARAMIALAGFILTIILFIHTEKQVSEIAEDMLDVKWKIGWYFLLLAFPAACAHNYLGLRPITRPLVTEVPYRSHPPPVVEMIRICTSCEKVNPGDSDYCTGCGMLLTVPAVPADNSGSSGEQVAYCGQCGTRGVPGAGFCTNCGSRLDQPGGAETVEIYVEGPERQCTMCGTSNPGDSKYCKKCGTLF